MTEDEIKTLKTKFAHAMLRDKSNPFGITQALFPDNIAEALRAAQTWEQDEFVLSEFERIIGEQEEGNLAFLPDKAAAAKLAWDMANGYGDLSDKTKALELYMKARNFMPKEAKVEVNVTHNRIMKVKDHGTDDEWQTKVKKQQDRLKSEVNDSASKPTIN